MNKHLVKLAEKLNANLEYQKKISECKSEKEIFNYCTSICGGYTEKELKEFILGIISIKKLNKVSAEGEKFDKISVEDEKLQSISGGMEKGTVKQITDKINAFSGAQNVLLNISKAFDKMIFIEDTDNLSPQEMMQLAMDVANSLGLK